MQRLRKLSFTLLLMSLMTLVACGGGDGGLSEGGGGGGGGGGTGATDNITLTLIKSTGNLSAANDVKVSATVLNNGIPVADKTVTFTLAVANSAILDPIAGTATTDANGLAEINVKVTDKAGSVNVSASYASVTSDISFDSTGDGSEVGKNELTITSFTNSTSISNATPATITIHFEQADGTDLSDEVITFTSTLGVLDPLSGTVLTNSTGDATITLSAGTVRGAGLLTVSSRVDDVITQGFFSEGDSVSSGVNVSLSLEDNDGNKIEQISSISSGKLVATVTGVKNAVIVTFITDLGTIPIQTAIATSGSGYIATVDLLAGNSLGAGTATAQLTTGESKDLIFSIGSSSLGMGYSIDESTGLPNGLIEVPSGIISAGATAGLSVSIWDVSNASPNTPATLFTTETVEVTFTSGCTSLTSPTAKIDSPVATIAGIAQSTYLAQGCEGDDIVTATANAGGTVLSATGTVKISSPDSGSIEFVSATPPNISLKGVGGIESSTVVFRVRDTNGNVVANKDVKFSLNTEVGGINWSPKKAETDSNGLVQTVVNSGTVHTSVRVRADLDENTSIFTQSNLLVISTGIPDQDSFSLSASILNPEAWNHDGTEVTITARLADAFNNPAPDGTAVAFTTEGGSIGDSCVTIKGACSVLWTSQNVRPEGQELGQTNDGPTLIKSFLDISKGFDFTSKQIAFSVATTNGTDSVSLNTHFESKAELLASTNALLVNSGIKAVSGFENLFELISTEGLDITITDVSAGSVTTFDVLGMANGITYYNNATQILGLSRINRLWDGKDFSTNDISFTVTTTVVGNGPVIATIILDEDYSSSAAIISRINAVLTNSESPVVASEYIENGRGYLKLTTSTNLDITIADQTGTGSTTPVELGINDGTAKTFVGTSAIKIINAGKGFIKNKIKFSVETVDGSDIITLNDNNDTPSGIVTKINTQLTSSSVVASELIYAGDSYLLLQSPTRLDIKITDDSDTGVGTSTTFAELGIGDGTTFSSRINSASPRTSNFMAQKYGGRATISATAIGEESFPDFNGNGLYDNNEKDAFLGNNGSAGLDVNGVPYDLAESFVDYNEDGIYNPQVSAGFGETGGEQEKFDDFNTSNDFDLKDNQYNGSLCGDADNCSVSKSINVRGSLVLVMSGSHPRFVTNYPTAGDSIDIVQDGTGAAAVTIADLHNQPMPQGTTVTFQAAVGSIKGISTFIWPSTNVNGGSSFSVTVEGVKDKNISGPLTVTVETPLGVITLYTVANINITTS